MGSKHFGLDAKHLQVIEHLQKSLSFNRDHATRIKVLQNAIHLRDSQGTAILLNDGLKIHGPEYPLLLIIEAEETITEVYAQAGIEDVVRDATLSDIRLWVDHYASLHAGSPGLERIYWISRHLCANILRLGRLQFERKPFGYPFNIYQRTKDHTMLTIAAADLLCDERGYLSRQSEGFFTTTFKHNASFMEGHLVHPETGTIEKHPTRFSQSEILQKATPESIALHLHIPAGPPLFPSAVEDSLKQAKKHFPAIPLVACSSWLLDPALDEVTETESNINAFMHRFSKFPVAHEEPQIYERVFGFSFTEAEVLAFQATTTLQKKVQQAITAGIQFHTMGGYLSQDNVPYNVS
ncbi:MAG: acyltransferase domain-containing protein [Sphaerochaetaceae bacterium]